VASEGEPIGDRPMISLQVSWRVCIAPPPFKVGVFAVGEPAFVLGILLAGMIALPCLPLGCDACLALRSPPLPHFAV